MPEYLKIRHDVFPDFEVVELSEYKEKRNDYYEHWSVWKEAPPSEIPSTPTPGPNVQSFENESNSEELSMSENDNGEVVVELGKEQEQNEQTEEDLIEVDPYSDRAEKMFSEEELSALREAELEDNPERSEAYEEDYDEMMENISSEMKELKRQERKERQREELRDKVETWDPRYGKKVEEMTAEQFSDLMANAQEGKTLEEELDEEVDRLLQEEEEEENEEELSSEVDPQTAKEAVEAWGNRDDAFGEFASELENRRYEGKNGWAADELEEDDEPTPVETSVNKHGNGDATVTSNDPQIKSELRSAEKEGFAEILEEGDTMEAEVQDYENNL